MTPALFILIIIGALVLWVILARCFEKIGNFILKNVVEPFQVKDDDKREEKK